MTARRIVLGVIWVLGSFLVMVLGGLDEPRSGGVSGRRSNATIPIGLDLGDWPIILAWVVFTGYMGWLMVRDGRDRPS